LSGGTGTITQDFRNQSSVLSASFLKCKGTFLDVLILVGLYFRLSLIKWICIGSPTTGVNVSLSKTSANYAINESKVSLDLFKLGIFISCAFAGNLGEIKPAFCMSFHAIKQFDNKWETTNASICNFLPLSMWMSKMTLPTHPNEDEFATIIFSLPPGSYAISALSSKLFKIMVLDVPVSGRAVQW
jgi:hypothetical protein